MVSVFGEKIGNAVSEYLTLKEYKVVALTTSENGSLSSTCTDFATRGSIALGSRAVLRITTIAYSSPSIYGIVSVSKIQDNYPKLLASFQVDQSEFKNQIVNGIASCLVASGICVPSLLSLLQMDDIRRVLLKHMSPKDLAILSCANKTLDFISKKQDVDGTFWKYHLKKDFNMVADRFCNRKKYYTEANAQKKRDLEQQSRSQQSRLMVNQPDNYNPGFPRPGPYYPDPHHPDAGPYFPDPLNPNGPFFPSAPGRFPAPWDPNSSEMLPSRSPRNLGPRQLGGSNQFGNNDFI